LRTVRFTRRNTLRVAEAYRAWSSNQRDAEDVQPVIFAEQVAYVFFVRLLLVRVLEDKKVIASRIASDGGFGGWAAYLKQHFGELDGISILNEIYCGLLNRKAGSYYLHFFQQPVFDWFIPDDYLLVETLEFLGRYHFGSVASDVIGFTYEEYIDRNARSRKGHFLTRPEVVEYMLDLLGYTSADVIGKRILDPACGSGSFLVHAARRYRSALVAALCRREGLPHAEESLAARPELRSELARTYLDGLAENFHGMEINPFSCYLAEMNLLIQSLDDLAYLQDTQERFSIERFRIFNTNSLELPYTILHADALTDAEGHPPVQTDYLSERLTDEAFPIKAKLNGYAGGFSYIIFNPPYVSSKREQMDVQRLRAADFFADVLSGDTNLFLLFLKLAAYYLSDYGRTVFVIPLTIFGDRSSGAARRLLRTAPLTPSAAIRFYRGDILFPGVDQAVGILRIEKSVVPERMLVAGGNTVEDVRANAYELPAARVLGVVPAESPWNGAWLVANEPVHAAIWEQARQKSQQLTHTLGSLLNAAFAARQGDVNATHLNSYRVGQTGGAHASGHIAVYKGEDIAPFAPLPSTPSDWVMPRPSATNSTTINRTLSALQAMTGRDVGIVRREVARLNTRERLIATWFERDAHAPFVFTHETWRMTLRSGVAVERGKALLVLLNCKAVSFLVNLLSSNN
ncbi:MAG: SAM-dependent methyltransferase, partial [Armatimonadota bacterium]|nr:SAM-dependent methyltransferase [Armatimonadota bacterium]